MSTLLVLSGIATSPKILYKAYAEYDGPIWGRAKIIQENKPSCEDPILTGTTNRPFGESIEVSIETSRQK